MLPRIAAWMLAFAATIATPLLAATTPGTSTVQNPVVTFNATGLQTVTLTSCNALGCNSVSHQVLVLPALPAVTSYSASPAQVTVGQPITLAATATGQPPLTYSWLLIFQGLVPVGTLTGSPVVWDTTGYPSGSYTVQLTVTGASGVATQPIPVALVTAASTHFYTLSPCRVLDTRDTSGSLVPTSAPLVIPVVGTCGVPPEAKAVAVNVTAVAATGSGSLTLYPADFAQPPLASSASFAAGQTRAAASVLPLSTDGTGALAAQVALTTGHVDLVVDVNGYFAP
jgi:PKD repeat protein